MGYKCGNCGTEFCGRRPLIEHMVKYHNSPFIEGDVDTMRVQQKILDEMEAEPEKAAKAKEHKALIKYHRGE